jgi:hypothetical protein
MSMGKAREPGAWSRSRQIDGHTPLPQQRGISGRVVGADRRAARPPCALPELLDPIAARHADSPSVRKVSRVALGNGKRPARINRNGALVVCPTVSLEGEP